MAKYLYPAVFTKEDVGYSVNFPDLKNCFTSGSTLEEAMDMANDVLCLTLYDMEQDGQVIPTASTVNSITHDENEFVSLVGCDTIAYRRFFDNKAVKKTLSIPSWLNDMAERAGINFSGTLQDALKAKLNIG
ncbi:type II toxin-antitoxin system HicB family antitoxin [Faecalibacterium prausnitzii]|jgi:antitoxin HicB|uniref:type II toxin-antitoxin system HicB family antitoxin n=1 Tax=Faecalibacterium prausnitzii TaxID=853 RepID=UPI000E4101E1|nr:type II toxin-antitoxin system HicB family antitoxin [Faecalibacterium prausnitzii]RGC40261.1 type II toxin-antitoxin system HicB family antitoxin [Faecalibacterium prausnitzii]